MPYDFASCLHVATAVGALLLGPLYAFAPLPRKSHRCLADAYFGSMLLMALSGLILRPSETRFSELHLASVLVMVLLGLGWSPSFLKSPSAARQDREVTSALESYGILLLSTLLETTNRILVPWLTARGFSDWLVFWSVVGAGLLVLVGVSFPMFRAARRRLERYRPGA
jgi:uncharacterized membrane protein